VATSRSSAYAAIKAAHPKTKDPISLICVPTNGDAETMKALYKLVGAWLIVDDDETASAIISNKAYAAAINGCVTLLGVCF
jgi:hypothetical protein